MIAFIASVALLATTAIAQSVGSAIVINACNYDVHVCNVPAAYGGYDEIDKVLSPNETYEQTFTELTNQMGWSIKLSKTAVLANIMQYEYTYHPGEPIWFDLSDVDGNPWDGNWEITSEGDCTPKQSAYRYSTDDAYGMQSCPANSIITVTLCSGESQNDGVASSASASMSSAASTISTSAPPSSTPSAIGASTNTPIISSTYVAPSSFSHAPSVSSSYGHGRIAEVSSTPTPTPTTMATSTIATSSTEAEAEPETTYPPDAVIVTEIATAVVTEIVTATAYKKRAEHVHRHAHHARMRA